MEGLFREKSPSAEKVRGEAAGSFNLPVIHYC